MIIRVYYLKLEIKIKRTKDITKEESEGPMPDWMYKENARFTSRGVIEVIER